MTEVSRLPATTVVPDGLEDIADEVSRQLPQLRIWLEDLVRIPSISALSEHRDDLDRSAQMTGQLLTAAGFDDVQSVTVDDSPPYVTGQVMVDPAAPTVLLYAHHDVQPVATADRWTSAPFEPTERDGRLFGRGAADDKAGIVAHIGAVSAWTQTRGAPPLNVKVIIEGEEEIGSPRLASFLAQHGNRLRADVIVLTDLTNWQVGWPGLTRSLRGMGDVFVTLRTLEQPIHSGMWGGVVPDALTAMSRLLASLHDDDGAIAVAGFADDVAPTTPEQQRSIDALDLSPEDVRRDTRLREGVKLTGDPTASPLERLWNLPTITPTGMDVPAVAEASNTLLAEVRIKLSLRFAPGQDPERAIDALRQHLSAHTPWGAELDVVVGAFNAAWQTSPTGPAWDAAVAAMTAAYGRAPAVMGCGGSIPFVAPFSAAFGDVPCLLVGVEDPASNAHGEDESLHLDDFARTCLTEAFLLDELARRLAP